MYLRVCRSCLMKESYKWCGVPWSCCHSKYQRNRQCGYGMRKDRAKFNLANEIHTIGCLDKGFEFFRNNMGRKIDTIFFYKQHFY